MSSLQPSASAYTQGHSPYVVASHASRTIHNSAQFLLPHIKPTFTIVDLGCGPGTITRGFGALVPQGRVIGIDASDTVIAQARNTASAEKDAIIEFQVGNITARLPFDDDSIDVVYTHQALCHIPAPIPVIKEAFRILKPGGLIAMREYDHMSWHPHFPSVEAFNIAMDKSISAGSAQGAGSGRRLHAWALQAGFQKSKIQVGAGTTIHVDEEAKWWADVCIGRLGGEIGATMLEKGIVKSQEDLEGMKHDLKRWAEDAGAWYACLQGEVIAWK